MGSFLVLLGGSWGFFWCSWGLQVVPRILKTFYLGTLEPPSCPPRSPQQPQTAPQAPYVHLNWLFFLSWTLLVMILTSQAVPPTLKNLDFASAGARFSKNQGWGSEDALSGVWWLSLAPFWCSWGRLGGSFGALGGSRWHPDISKLFIWAPLSPHLGPRGALNNPKLLPKRPHGEAEGPTKPPNPIWTRISTYFPAIWWRNQRKKKIRYIVQAFRSESPLSSYFFIFFILFLSRIITIRVR